MNLPTLNFLSFESRATNRYSLALFTLFIATHLVVVFALLRYFFRPTWDQQWSAGTGVVVLTILGCNVVFCFGEFLFHRYLLHVPSVQFLGRLCFSHLNHHKLTSIGFTADNTVRSQYPIVDAHSDDGGTFPPWALLAFMAVLTPFLAVIAFSFPTFPVLIGGYTAIAVAHFLYETIHLAHHTPYDPWWKDKIASPVFGTMWRKLYGFHQAHHANYKCNMNIAGFFGLPLADLVLGTYEQPEVLLLDGVPATKEMAAKLTAHPRWPISWFDAAMLERRKRMSREQSARAAARKAATSSAGWSQPVVDPASPGELQ